MKTNKIQENIKNLVKLYPDVVKNNNLLVVQYWLIYDGLTYWKDVKQCTPAESITRAFRHLKRNEEIEVDQAIENMRMQQEQKFRQEYSPYVH